MLCDEFGRALPLLRDLLSPAEEQRLRAHALECPACAALEAEYAADEQRLSQVRGSQREVPALLGFTDAVMAKVATAERLPPQPAPLLLLNVSAQTWLAAALLLLGLGLGLQMLSPPSEGTPTALSEPGPTQTAPQRPALPAPEAVVSPARLHQPEMRSMPRRQRGGARVVPVDTESRSGGRERGQRFMRNLQKMFIPGATDPAWGESQLPPLREGEREVNF